MGSNGQPFITGNHDTVVDHRRRILRVMLHIDQTVGQPCSLDGLSDLACLSRYHFQRLFVRYTGETPGNYLIRKRLEMAARRLAHSTDRITDIAFDSGYESHNAFCKAFKKWSGISPSVFRRNPASLTDFQSFIFNFSKCIPGGAPSEPTITQIKPRRLYYIEKRGFSGGSFVKAGQEAATQLSALIRELGMTQYVRAWISAFPRRPVGLLDQSMPIRCGVVLSSPTEAIPGLHSLVIGGGRFAVFCHWGPYEYLFQTWSAAYFGWLPALGLKPRNAVPFEWYQDPFSDMTIKRTLVHVPII